MVYEKASHIGISQAETADGEDELQAESFSEFLRALLVSLAPLSRHSRCCGPGNGRPSIKSARGSEREAATS